MKIVARKVALAEGLPRYFTGKSCKRGHLSERRVQDLTCMTCNRERARLLYQKDPVGFRARQNRDVLRKASRKWKRRNWHLVLATNARRRALKAGAAVGDRREYAAYVRFSRTAAGLVCFYCGKATPIAERQLDHKTPLSRGGADSVENLCVACASCNARKNDRTAEEFMARLHSSDYNTPHVA